MLSGVVTNETLDEVLRGISQRRLQGVLDLILPERRLRILFARGKILDICDSSCEVLDEVAAMLGRAGRLKAGFVRTAGSYADLYGEIARFQGEALLDRETFALAVKHRVLERFYSLELASGASYQFIVQALEPVDGFRPNISVAQLLMDWVSLPVDVQRFETQFNPETGLQVAETAPQFEASEEKLVYQLIGAGLSVADLLECSILSRIETQRSVLALHARGLVAVVSLAKAAADEEPAPILCEEASGEQNAEGFCAPSDLGAAVRLDILNAKLLHQGWPVQVVVITFLLFAVFAPLFWWGEVFSTFGKF